MTWYVFSENTEVRVILMVAIPALFACLLIRVTERYIGLTRLKTVKVVLASIAGAAIVGLRAYQEAPSIMGHIDRFGHPRLSLAIAACLPLVTVPFVVRLYQKWIEGRLTEAEKAPDMEGIRAWLRGGNLICALAISLCAWWGFDYSFVAMAALTLMALIAYPLLNSTLLSFGPVPEPQKDDLSAERERVLNMLDTGRINAQESAELLNALGQTTQPRRPPPAGAGANQKMIFVGLGLVLLGFFLPWFSYRPQEEMARLVGEMPATLDLPAGMAGTIEIAGGGVGHGLGWLVLLFGIAAAALPYLAEGVSEMNRRKTILAGLGAGGLILLYLLTQNMRYVSIGILLAMAGYVFEFIGVLKERQAA